MPSMGRHVGNSSSEASSASDQAYAGPQHPQHSASLLDADPLPRPPPGPPHLLEQLLPSPQLELQLGPQVVQVRAAPMTSLSPALSAHREDGATQASIHRCGSCYDALLLRPRESYLSIQAGVLTALLHALCRYRVSLRQTELQIPGRCATMKAQWKWSRRWAPTSPGSLLRRSGGYETSRSPWRSWTSS